MRTCDVLFVGRNQVEAFERKQATIAGLPTLVIGEASGFAERGGMINLIPEERKLSFEINQEALKEVGLRPASQLLRLARRPAPAVPAGAP